MIKPLPYLLLRLLIGMSFFGHGLVRLPKLEKFSAWMAGQFHNSYLPEILVKPFSYVLPFGELITGLLLLMGFLTRQACIGGVLIILVLIFGTSMTEEWGSIPSQLIHGSILVYLLQHITSNHYAVDAKLKLQQ